MTKEEFLSMISNELEKLEQEYQTASQQAEYFKAIGSSDRIPEETEYKLKIVKQKIETLKNLVTLPAYARIEAMSDIEIEEYKKEKVEELELEIKEIQAKVEQGKEKLAQLQAEQKKLMEEFAKLTGDGRDIIIAQGKQISTEITKQENELTELEEKVESIKKQQEEIKAKTPLDIKQQLLSQIKESDDLKKRIQNSNNQSISEFTKLEATVASDSEKAMEMAKLLVNRNTSLYYEQQRHSHTINFNYLPELLQQRLEENSDYYSAESKSVHNPDKLIEIISEFESIFKREKEKFMKEFTEEKLVNLAGKMNGVYGSDVNMDFLRKHNDKLANGELDHLQSLIEQKNILEMKMFKTRKIKDTIDSLNNQIHDEQSKIYKKIICWYTSQSKDILGIDKYYGFMITPEIINFQDTRTVQASLERAIEDISKTEQEIAKVKEELQKIKSEMEHEKQVRETHKTNTAEIEQKIRALGGDEYKDTKIPTDTDIYHNVDEIRNAPTKVYESDIIKSIQEEAQRQADMKEAELRGTTLDELLKIKKQVQELGTVPGTPGEDNSQLTM